MSASDPSVSAAVQTARHREWDEHAPKLAQQALQQLVAPVRDLATDWHRLEVLRILHADTTERCRRLPLFADFDAVDPLAVREAAVRLSSDAQFHAFLLLEVWHRVLRDLRRLQLDLLGYPEPPGVHEGVAATQRRLQRQQRRRRLVTALPKPRRTDPAFEELFRPEVKGADIVEALQARDVLNAAGQWAGISGRKRELVALVMALSEGGYLATTNRTALARAFSARFGCSLSRSLAARWDLVPNDLVEQFRRWFPPRGRATKA
ncbi:hypothetical protein [Hymenobacter edaphi]|uniref:Uncharacterized protein n=1 Tax=Hymenobacter edaphi TaxID=2211146 RepID=A0A328B7N9_9BACT|nr:hypothetical protein [Hymenobacter edaphi]RAK63440.1 hypothetical protein DLM85_20755 [Hymenobacter edaphi]